MRRYVCIFFMVFLIVQMFCSHLIANSEKSPAPTLSSAHLHKFRELLDIAEKNQNDLLKSLALMGLGVTYSEARNYSQALEFYEKSLKVAEEIDDKQIISQALLVIGIAYRELNKYSQALEYFQRSLSIAKKIPNKELITKNYANIAIVQEHLHNNSKALAYYQKSLEATQGKGEREIILANLLKIGEMYYLQGDYQTALRYFRQVYEQAEQLENDGFKEYSLSSMGIVYSVLGNRDRAFECFQQALDIAKETQDQKAISRNILLLGSALRSLGKDTEALVFLQNHLSFIEGKTARGVLMYCIGDAFFNLGHYTSALKYFQLSLDIATENSDEHEMAVNLCNIGRVFYEIGNYTLALQSSQNALEIAKNRNILGLLFKINFYLGNIYRKLGYTQNALTCYKNSIQEIESLRERLSLEAYKIGFIQDKISVYNQIILLLLELEKIDEAFHYAERAKSRALLDILTSKIRITQGISSELMYGDDAFRQEMNVLSNLTLQEETKTDSQNEPLLRNFNSELKKIEKHHQQLIKKTHHQDPELTSIIHVNPLKYNEVQNLLDQNTTLLEYYLTKDAVLIWVMNKTELHAVKSLIDIESLDEKVNLFKMFIENKLPGYVLHSKKLFEILIAPALPYIKTNKLCIVPHLFLHHLPFQALSDGKQFLIEKYEIFYSTSASLLQFCVQKRKKELSSLLAFSKPDKSLQYVEQEIQEIKKNFAQVTIFTRDNATESRVKALSSKYNVLHFACHAILTPTMPLNSHLLLTRDEKEDGKLTVGEIFNLKLSAATLVTLSACDTALGEIELGDELIGFVQSFLYAGTPSIIASLWKVDDEATSLLMKELYANLKTYSKIEALRRAQSTLMHTSSSKDTAKCSQKDYSHPYYWAPYVLIGDWK